MTSTDLSVLEVVLEQSKRVLETYRIDPGLIQEHANAERRISQGGYGDRQIYELVQNGADELREDRGGEIAVVLTSDHLYCANQGAPISATGTDTILRMSASRKRGGQIGRFGVGVKSVLSVTDSPEFYSSTGSFGFDRAWSTTAVRSVRPEVVEVPVLRMARPIDRKQAAATDQVLAELLRWATTVVRLPLRTSSVKGLARDISQFPIEFLLFSPHVGTVTLEDRSARKPFKRQIFQRVDGDRRAIQEETGDGRTSTSHWRVFTRVHRPSGGALLAAGELHDRPEIDIAWAVPDRRGRESRLGEFWAYFPTKYKTTLRGIVNAPWKTSEDRQNLYDGNEFNEELIRAMAELVVESLPLISRAEDPASFLDFTPARGREEPQWASDRLVDAVWSQSSISPSLPDQMGALRRPTEIRLHPSELKTEWLELWRGCEDAPPDWVHHSVESHRLRRASAELICNTARVPIASIREWLEALVRTGSPAGSAAAIRIVAEIVRNRHALSDQALAAHVVLTESNHTVTPTRGQVFRRSTNDSLSDAITYVDERVIQQFGTLSALEELGIHEADAVGRFAAVVGRGFHGYGDEQWSEFWELSRHAGPATAVSILLQVDPDTSPPVFVRTAAGEFKRFDHCLLPGAVVPADGSRDGHIAVDLTFHEADRQVLRELGMSDTPRTNIDPRGEPWFERYVEACVKQHNKSLPSDAPRVQPRNIRLAGADPAGPLHLLEQLSDEGKAAFLSALPLAGVVPVWHMQVGGMNSPRRSVLSPLAWVARTYGLVRTGKGLRRPAECVGPMLRDYSEFFPVAELAVVTADALRLPADLTKLRPALWDALLREVDQSEDDEFPGRVYELLFDLEIELPESIGNTRCRVGDSWTSDLPDDQIAVTSVRAEYELLVREEIPVILVPSDQAAKTMLDLWRMRSPDDLIAKEIRYVELGEPVPVLTEFPPLRMVNRKMLEGWTLVRCSELEEITRTPGGARGETIPFAVKDKSVLVLRPQDDLAALSAIDHVLKLKLGEETCRSILERRRLQEDNELKKRVRSATLLEDRILHLVGPEELKRNLPDGLLENERQQAYQEPDERRIARLALDAHGDRVLKVHAKQIGTRLSSGAPNFRGDMPSRQLVDELGLPESFAGAKGATSSRDAVEQVNGPVRFPSLHVYQERLASKMFDLLTRATAQRAMLCLPTGAGKTRVAAEAVIRVIKERGLGGRPVLWIAQTDELCEQAVQSWKFVWEKVGAAGRLTISRLWASNSAVQVRDNPHLVVATDAKLESCLDTERYEWLRQAALVIVDEAHCSITPRYTQLFKSLGITHNRTERPLIGLTATPFRGFNDSETRRLVERYGANRLDLDVFDGDPYESLQELGMLAKVEHRELTGATMQLTERELDATLPFQLNLPSAAEQRLAQNSDRNNMLLNEIRRLPKEWPVLLFATSVGHAKLMQAMLNGKGIRSVAIDSATPAEDRRRAIEDYRTGKIQVIANYGVLAQGFDAPATRVVIVARPTYSPNVYTQMIGRGLRGPKNGGKETCLILDVKDNITNYRNALVFTGLEHLWGTK